MSHPKQQPTTSTTNQPVEQTKVEPSIQESDRKRATEQIVPNTDESSPVPGIK